MALRIKSRVFSLINDLERDSETGDVDKKAAWSP
jgi:hypothetical protein